MTLSPRGWWRPCLDVLVAFALAHFVIVLAAALAGEDPRSTKAFVHWDAFRYIEIARQGYGFDWSDVKSSNAGWFPGYALAIRSGMALGLRPAKAGKLVAEAFALLTLVGLAALLEDVPAETRRTALLLAALFPGFIYHHGVFPISLASAFTVAAAWLWKHGRFTLAGACGAVASFSYPSSIACAGGLLVAALVQQKLDPLRRLGAVVRGAFLAGSGFAAALAYQAYATGRWDAYFACQRAQGLGEGVENPFAGFLAHTSLVWSGRFEERLLPHLQSVVVAVLVLAALAVVVRRGRAADPAHVVLVGSAVGVGALALTAGVDVSIYRQEALLVGIVLPLARLPRSVLPVLLAAAAALGVGMGALFFRDVLI